MANISIPPPFLVNSLVIIVMIYVGRVQEVIPGLSGYSIGKFAIGIVLFQYVFSRDKNPERQPLWSFPGWKYLVCISVIAIGSIPGSVWQQASLNFVISSYLKLIVFVYLVAIIPRTRNDLIRISYGLIISAIILSAGTIINPKYELDRLSTSGSYDSNDIALVLVMILPVLYYFMLEAGGFLKMVLLAAIGLSIIVIPMTGSRGGILALIAVVAAILLKHGLKSSIKLLPILVTVLFFVLSDSPHLQRYIGIANLESDYNMDQSSGRIAIWKRTSILILKNPIFGSGAGCFAVAESQTHNGKGKWSAAHNSFIQIGVELGMIALFLHIWIIVVMIRQWREEGTWLGKGFEVSLYAYCVGGFFLSWAFAYAFYFILAISIAAARLKKIEVEASGDCTMEQPWRVRQRREVTQEIADGI